MQIERCSTNATDAAKDAADARFMFGGYHQSEMHVDACLPCRYRKVCCTLNALKHLIMLENCPWKRKTF